MHYWRILGICSTDLVLSLYFSEPVGLTWRQIGFDSCGVKMIPIFYPFSLPIERRKPIRGLDRCQAAVYLDRKDDDYFENDHNAIVGKRKTIWLGRGAMIPFCGIFFWLEIYCIWNHSLYRQLDLREPLGILTADQSKCLTQLWSMSYYLHHQK